MRLLLKVIIGLCIIAVQVILGARVFFPEALVSRQDIVDEIIEKKDSVLDRLSPEDLAWIGSHRVVIVGVDPNFYPLEMFDERGRYTGLGGDYMRLLAAMTGLDFQVLRLTDWASTEEQAKQRNIDIFMAAAKTERRSEYMNFTKPYITMPGVIMTRRGHGMDEVTIDDLSGKKVAVVNNYSWHDFLKEHHPEIVAVPAENTLAALQMVANGAADAIIDYEFNLLEKIQVGGILQIQTAGTVSSTYGHSVAVRNDSPALFNAIALALDNITPAEQKLLAQKWLLQERPAGQERHLQWIFFFAVEAVLLCLGLIALCRRKVRKEVSRRTRQLKKELAAAKAAQQA